MIMFRNDRNNRYYERESYDPLVPYMPRDPKVGYGYVPYQVNPKYYNDLAEAHYYGTIYPELVTPYLQYISREV